MRTLTLAAALLAAASYAWADGAFDWAPAAAPADQAADDLRAGRYAAAISQLERHLEVQPEDADAWTYLGYAQRKTGAFRSSRASYERALALAPDHLNAHAYFGALLVQTGDAAGLRRQEETLARLCPQGCDARAALAAEIAGRDKAPW